MEIETRRACLAYKLRERPTDVECAPVKFSGICVRQPRMAECDEGVGTGVSITIAHRPRKDTLNRVRQALLFT